jgi:hypothetical protein
MTTNNSALNVLLNKEQIRTLNNELGGARVFFTTRDVEVTDDKGGKSTVTESAYEQAAAHIEAVAAKTADSEGNPFFGVELSMRADGIEAAEQVCVATVGVRDKKSNTNGVKAIVVFEAPTADNFLERLEDAKVRDWIAKLIEREAIDVAFSNLRQPDLTADDFKTVVAGMPATIEDIISSARESIAGDTEAFDSLWQPFKEGVLKTKAPAVHGALVGIPKADVIKSIRSSAYAKANPRTQAMEAIGMWEKIARGMISAAPNFMDTDGKPAPVDPSAIIAWVDGRDSTVLTYTMPKIDETALAAAAEIDF